MAPMRRMISRVARMPGIRVIGLIALAAVAAGVVLCLPPIPQSPAYHHFADTRGWLGVPSFLNVVSNAVYAVPGVAGLWVLMRRPASRLGWIDRLTFGTLFVGVLLTTFGSTWYHLDPCNATLLWDRLPMTVAFMGFACGLVAERINAKAGAILLGPLIVAGIASVLYWYATELHGAGDMRPYILVQGLSMLMVPYAALVWPGRYLPCGDVLIAGGWYALAKVLEVGDGVVFSALGGTVSGHTLKHLAAAMGAYWIARTIGKNAGGGIESGDHAVS